MCWPCLSPLYCRSHCSTASRSAGVTASALPPARRRHRGSALASAPAPAGPLAASRGLGMCHPLPNAPGSPRVRWRRGMTGYSSAGSCATYRPRPTRLRKPSWRMAPPCRLVEARVVAQRGRGDTSRGVRDAWGVSPSQVAFSCCPMQCWLL